MVPSAADTPDRVQWGAANAGTRRRWGGARRCDGDGAASPAAASMALGPGHHPGSRPGGRWLRRDQAPTDGGLGEAGDLGAVEDLGDCLLVVPGVRLFQKNPPGYPLVPATELAFDDLGKRLLGLAFVASLGLERGPFGCHLVRRNVVTAEIPRLAERDMNGNVVRQFGGGAGQLDDDPVDAPAILNVEVGVDHVSRLGGEARPLFRLRCSP